MATKENTRTPRQKRQRAIKQLEWVAAISGLATLVQLFPLIAALQPPLIQSIAICASIATSIGGFIGYEVLSFKEARDVKEDKETLAKIDSIGSDMSSAPASPHLSPAFNQSYAVKMEDKTAAPANIKGLTHEL